MSPEARARMAENETPGNEAYQAMQRALADLETDKK